MLWVIFGSLLAKHFFKEWLMCAFEVLTDAFQVCSLSFFFFFSQFKFHPQKQTLHTDWKRRLGVHPGELLDRDDMTYHSRVYHISFWQIRPAWGGTAGWWERLRLKIGQRGLQERVSWGLPWLSIQECLWWLPQCLFACDNNRITDIFGYRGVMHWKAACEMYTAKRGERFNCLRPLSRLFWGIFYDGWHQVSRMWFSAA